MLLALTKIIVCSRKWEQITPARDGSNAGLLATGFTKLSWIRSQNKCWLLKTWLHHSNQMHFFEWMWSLLAHTGTVEPKRFTLLTFASVNVKMYLLISCYPCISDCFPPTAFLGILFLFHCPCQDPLSWSRRPLLRKRCGNPWRNPVQLRTWRNYKSQGSLKCPISRMSHQGFLIAPPTTSQVVPWPPVSTFCPTEAKVVANLMGSSIPRGLLMGKGGRFSCWNGENGQGDIFIPLSL